MDAFSIFRSRLDHWKLRRLPPLHAAAARGDVAEITELIENGTSVNTLDSAGRTPLHHAIAREQAAVASELLSRGADHQICDRRGQFPIAAEHPPLELLHTIRQQCKRRSGTNEWTQTPPTSPAIADRLERLRRDGFIKLDALVSPHALSEMHAGFAKWIAHLDQKRARGTADKKTYDEEEHWWGDDLAYVSNNAFAWSCELANLCRRSELAELANRYYGRTAHVTRGVAMRYLPHEERQNDMFDWHHDMEEKRFKLMILLTDLDPTDQVMSYVLGSHVIYHPYSMYFRNTCTLDYCRERLGDIRIEQTIGRAGDVFVFDSNGVHRGNRRPDAAVRDAFFVEYDIDRSNVWGGDLVAQVPATTRDSGNDPLAWFAVTQKKWERTVTRTNPTWVENLPFLDRWR